MQRDDDRAGAQEQQRLEKRVRGQMEHRRRRAAQADGHDHVAELRERRVGDDAFDVVLLDGDERGEQRGESADVGDDVQRVGVEQKQNAAKHVNAGGHHRRGVDERGDRRRAFHGVRQPHVQRELRGFADRAAENQKAGNRRRSFRAPRNLQQVEFANWKNSANRAFPRPSECRAEIRSRRGGW